MDTPVALVQAYLNVNGYFTVVEYPVLEASHRGPAAGYTIRMVAFGAVPDTGSDSHWTTVPMGHVVDFLRSYLRDHWDVLRHAQIKDPTLGLLALLEKWGLKPENVTRREPEGPIEAE